MLFFLSLSSFTVFLFFATAESYAEETDRVAAKSKFDTAVESFEQKRFKEAADGFRESYQLKPSWKLLFNIGQADAAGKRYGLALDAFERYLVEGGDDVTEERQNEVRKEINRLRGMVGYLKISAPNNATVSINGVERGRTPLNADLPVAATVSLLVSADIDGKTIAEQRVKVNGGRTAVVDLIPKKTAENHTVSPLKQPVKIKSAHASISPRTRNPRFLEERVPLKVWGWGSIGVGGALLIGGGITGASAVSENFSLKSNCKDDGCYSSEYARLDRRNALATTSTVLFTTGGIVAATGLALVIIGWKRDEKEHPVSVLPGPGNLVLEGRF